MVFGGRQSPWPHKMVEVALYAPMKFNLFGTFGYYCCFVWYSLLCSYCYLCLFCPRSHNLLPKQTHTFGRANPLLYPSPASRFVNSREAKERSVLYLCESSLFKVVL